MILFFFVSSLSLADSLYAHGDYYGAATEYERFLFDNPSDDRADETRFQLALAFSRSGEPEKAEDILKGLIDRSPSWGKRARTALIALYFREKNYPLARMEVNDLLLSNPPPAEKNRLYALAGLLDLEEHNPASAALNFARAGEDSLCRAARDLERLSGKNPSLAALLSTIVPGTGELYAGRFRIGASALVVNALTVGGVVYTVAHKKYVDAVLIFSFLFPRFYFGSQRNARNFAHAGNETVYQRRLEAIRKACPFEAGIDR